MSIPIEVWLSEDVVEYLDRSVAEGRASSRAALISSALERQMRTEMAVADAAILREHGPDDDLDALVDWTVSATMTP